MRPTARAITIGDEPEAWATLGLPTSLGGIEVRLVGGGGGILSLEADGLTGADPDGLPLRTQVPDPFVRAARTEGSATGGTDPFVALDHVVAFTDSLDRTTAALEAVGLDLRRRRDPPEAPVSQGFFNLSSTILEVGETDRARGAAFWGLTLAVADLDDMADRLGSLLGTPRDAVQPGRRIATVRREAGLSVALALMTPRVRTRRGL